MKIYSLNNVRDEIVKYKLKEILSSGENDMFDNKIDRVALEKYLNEDEILEEENNPAVDLKKTLDDIDESKLFESIINLKYKNVE
jgi:hypothetical protein